MAFTTGKLITAQTGFTNPVFTGVALFVDGAVAAPAMSFTSDTNTGIWRPGADLMAFSTAGLEAFRVNASQNLLIGSTAVITGIGASRINSMGETVGTGRWALAQFTAGVAGPTLAFGKSRAATVNTYTIVTAGDTLANIEGWGADGSGMVLGARLQAYNIGTPAAGDVRGGWRIQTGSGAGVVATRVTVDDTTVTSTLPVKLPSYTVAGLPAAATAGAGAKAFVTNSNATHAAGIGATVAGGGANFVPVYSDGTNWKIG